MLCYAYLLNVLILLFSDSVAVGFALSDCKQLLSFALWAVIPGFSFATSSLIPDGAAGAARDGEGEEQGKEE